MNSRYTAYIDESGDEGFVFRDPPDQGSSEWWNISAYITDPAGNAALSSADAEYRRLSKKSRCFHFADEKHEHRLGFITRIATCPGEFISVMAHKPTLKNIGVISTKKHFLFYYTAKLLIERITWYMDYVVKNDTSEKIRIIFSDRGQLDRKDLDAYLSKLKNQTNLQDWLGVNIGDHDVKWNRIHNDLIDIQPHDSHLGLQAADAVASSIRSALEPTPHGITEHRYSKLLSGRVWRRHGRVRSYGLKFVPDEIEPPRPTLTNTFHWLKRYDVQSPRIKKPPHE